MTLQRVEAVSRFEPLIEQARALRNDNLPVIGVVHPCDQPSLQSAIQIEVAGFARPVLIGDPTLIRDAADRAGIESERFEIIYADKAPGAAAKRAAELACEGRVHALMKGALHSDDLLSAVVSRHSGLRSGRRISHVFLFDVPKYPKLLAISDCVVNIAPDLSAKRDILSNAVDCLRKIGISRPRTAVIAAVETPTPKIPATMDALNLASLAASGEWSDAVVEGPFGLDNAISAHSAKLKGIESRVAGEADLLLVPDVNAGNMLYKSLVYFAGAECAGLVIGARVPVVLASRADTVRTRLCSAAFAAACLGFERMAGA